MDNSTRFDVEKINKQSYQVAERIQKVYSLFKKINAIIKYADHKIYHSFALVQKYILNDN